MPAPVEARGLVKRYGEIVAVDHVDLTVEAGDVYGYLGPNGAGKTTSLRMLLGLIRPNEGSVRLFGSDPLADGARALDGVAGFVEAPRFYPYLSGRKNLELLAAYDGGGARERIDSVLETVELSDQAKNFVFVREAIELSSDPPAYLYRNTGEFAGTMSHLPERSEVPLPVEVDERLIVEFYS